MKLGLIGVGAVGSAVKKALEPHFEVAAYDKFKPEYQDFDGVLKSDVVFVAVPTLTLPDYKQDLEPVMDVFRKLALAMYEGVIVLKCTVLPGTTNKLKEMCPQLKIVHYPEFLTEKDAYLDFISQKSVILGGDKVHIEVLLPIFRKVLNSVVAYFFYQDPTTTEMIKYTHNTFLSAKVEFFNEIYDVCQKLGVKYDDIMAGVHSAGKVGKNHTAVPGPDGKRGFGGMCFPKDTKAFLAFTRTLGIIAPVLDATVYGNMPRRDDL